MTMPVSKSYSVQGSTRLRDRWTGRQTQYFPKHGCVVDGMRASLTSNRFSTVREVCLK
jgi:hypothetical protein